MKWINKIFGENSASTAKNRLKIVIAQERSASAKNQPDFLPLLHEEILAVIKKYMNVTSDMVEVDFKKQDNSAVLMLNVQLPTHVEAETKIS